MRKKLILIIDMQNGFQNSYTEGLDQRILRFLDLLEDKNAIDTWNFRKAENSKTAKDAGVLVAGTSYINHEQTACYRFEGWKACMAGTKDAQILDSLLPRMERTFCKDKYSCWNKEMQQYIRENEIEKVYFTGVNTGCCVLHSAFDFYNDLVDCSVIADLCASTSGRAEHEAALVILKSCITKERVISTEQAVEEIVNDLFAAQ